MKKLAGIFIIAVLLMMSCTSGPGQKHESATTKEKPRVSAEVLPGVYRVEANPSKGFKFHYYLLVPQTDVHEILPVLMVTTPATGAAPQSSDLSYHDKFIFRSITSGWESTIAKGIAAPQLRPIFPRDGNEWWYYTHALNRQTMQVKNRSFSRLDLQLIAMIRDAQDFLRDMGIETQTQVLMNGYSASGAFAQRFTLMHPEIVKAAAYGGIAVPTLPLANHKGAVLRYPVGIADLPKITGHEFNMERYSLVPQFYYEGSEDTNDPTLYQDSFEEQDSKLIHSLFGSNRSERMVASQELLNSLSLPITTAVYPNTGHQVTPAIMQDVMAFFRKHL